MDAPRIDNVSISSRYQVYVPCIIVLPAAWNLDRRYRWYDYQFRSFQIRVSLTVVGEQIVAREPRERVSQEAFVNQVGAVARPRQLRRSVAYHCSEMDI
jgi:site-specific recombinase XerC